MRVIRHVDLDAFFPSVEVREHPELKGKPIILSIFLLFYFQVAVKTPASSYTGATKTLKVSVARETEGRRSISMMRG